MKQNKKKAWFSFRFIAISCVLLLNIVYMGTIFLISWFLIKNQNEKKGGKRWKTKNKTTTKVYRQKIIVIRQENQKKKENAKPINWKIITCFQCFSFISVQQMFIIIIIIVIIIIIIIINQNSNNNKTWTSCLKQKWKTKRNKKKFD